MVAQVDTACCNSSCREESECREGSPLGKGSRRVGSGRVRLVTEQQEQSEGDGEEGDELRMGGWHAITFAEHFYKNQWPFV